MVDIKRLIGEIGGIKTGAAFPTGSLGLAIERKEFP
jgi:hypothetical protein